MTRLALTAASILALAAPACAQGAFGGMTELQEGRFYASNLIGMEVYNAQAGLEDYDPTIALPDGAIADWEEIGDVEDVILSRDGRVEALIIGLGGFLGIGERDVAVPMSAVKLLSEEGAMAETFVVISTTREALEAAPPFNRGLSGDELPAIAETTTDADMATTGNIAGSGAQMVEETDRTAVVENEMGAADPARTDAESEQTNLAVTSTAQAQADRAGQSLPEGQSPVQTERPKLREPMAEREGYAVLDAAELEALAPDEVTGLTVYGPNDEQIGEIERLIVDDRGAAEGVVLEVGGFLGLGEKPVAIEMNEIRIMRGENGSDLRAYIDATREELETQPRFRG